MKRIEIDSLSELKYVAQEVVESLDGRNVVLLRGEMGAGKTTLISRIAAYLGAGEPHAAKNVCQRFIRIAYKRPVYTIDV